MYMAELYHVLAAIAMRAINLASGTSNNVYHADKVISPCVLGSVTGLYINGRVVLKMCQYAESYS